ncbi:DUF7507 domain-containing protein [Nonomuraea longicatena]|uniref:DUF11 domain-containing protein n=1 Tax=Nonomuraea longicatena TaxID=83682 RepID=A0ABP4ADM7_9ACTN
MTTGLANYTGATGETYTADPYWLSRANCNGFILKYANATRAPNDCVNGPADANMSYARLRSLAYGLGLLNGTTPPTANSVLAAYTNTAPVGQVQLQTVSPIPLPPGGNRFIAFSVNAAAVNCDKAHPLMQFELLDGATAIPTGGQIDACTSGGSDVTVPDPQGGTVKVHTGTYATDAGVLFGGSSLGIRLLNQQPASTGNDGAIDDIRVLDVTPQLDKGFSPDTVPSGGQSTLTFTITNTAELGAKNGWSFTDDLPAGLTVASPTATTDCPGTTVTAPLGGDTVEVTGNIAKGQQVCTVSVQVTATTGVYINGPGNTTTKGLDPPGASTVTFLPLISLNVDKTAGADSYVPGLPFGYTITVTNGGPDTATNAKISDPLPGQLDGATWTCTASTGASCTASGSGDITDTVTIPAGGTLTYAVTGTVDPAASGNLVNTVTVTPPPNVVNPTCDEACTSTVTTPEEAPDAEVELAKSASPNDVASFVVGQQVTYQFEVTNTGNVPLSSIAITETEFTGSGTPPVISCPPGTLNPGKSTTCTGTYVLTQDDIDAGKVTNTATATGTPPGMTPPPVSDPASFEVSGQPAPAVSLSKSVTPASATTAGQEVTYQFEVTNTGNVTLTDVTIDEEDFSGTGPSPAVTCPPGSLAPGAKTTCSGVYTLTQADVDTGEVTNTATATGTPPSGTAPTSEPDSATVVIPSTPGLALSKQVSPVIVQQVGDTVAYTFTVINTGNVTISNVSVAETAFSGSGTAPECASVAVTLAPQQTAKCVVAYQVTQTDVNAGEVTNTAVAKGVSGGEPVESDPSSSKVFIVPQPALTLAKSAAPATVTEAGQQITYKFTVTNTGNVVLHDIQVGELSFNGAGTLSAISCPSGLLAVGDAATCTATYTVQAADLTGEPLVNSAFAIAKDPLDQTATSGQATASVNTVQPPPTPRPELTLEKSAQPKVVRHPGEEITYTFTVTNTGNVPIGDVTVQDTEFNGSGPLSIQCPPSARLLAPGASVRCTATYRVTEEDLHRGKLVNAAVATGKSPTGGTVTSNTAKAHVKIEAKKHHKPKHKHHHREVLTTSPVL